MKEIRRNAKFAGPLERINPEKDDPLWRLDSEKLQRFIKEQQSMERALNDNPARSKVIASIRREIQKAEIILTDRGIEIQSDL